MKISAAKKADRTAFFTLSPEAYRLRRATHINPVPDIGKPCGYRITVRRCWNSRGNLDKQYDKRIIPPMNRRFFFRQLASGLVAAAAPSLFLPKLIKPRWKRGPAFAKCQWHVHFIDLKPQFDPEILSASGDGDPLTASEAVSEAYYRWAYGGFKNGTYQWDAQIMARRGHLVIQ